MRWFASFHNGCHRHAYRLAYPVMDRWWRRHPHDSIAMALWVNGRILGVIHSYKSGLRLPGGATKRDETPLAAAIRETTEEVGVTLDAGQLRHVLTTQGAHGPRHLFEAELADEPPVRIDQREIVHAEFVRATVLTEESTPISDYLRREIMRREEAAPYRQPVFDW